MIDDTELRNLIDLNMGDRREEALRVLDSADYERLLELIKHELHRWVKEFELGGLTCELAGDRARSSQPQEARRWYERARAAYADGMAYATGSGEGWQFRELHDRVSAKMRGLRRIP
jgi:hypothetical protein